MTRFTASVQYGDWKGTAAADDLDKGDLRDYLLANHLMSDDEFLVGIELYCGENHPGRVRPPHAHALVTAGNEHDTIKKTLAECPDPIPLRRISLELTIEQFIGMFKRFSVTLTHRGLDLAGREYADMTLR